MAKDPKEQQKTDEERIPDKGTGKTDAQRLTEEIERPQGGAAQQPPE